MANLLSQFSSKPPKILHHYTDARGLFGIVSTKTLRATMLHYLNDSREFKYGMELISKEISQRLHATTNPSYREFYEQLVVLLAGHDNSNVCVFCVSENDDQLSQWRSYCPPGGGYAIGFGVNDLMRHLATSKGKHGPFRLIRCAYRLEDQQLIVSDLWNNLLPPALQDLDRGSSVAHVMKSIYGTIASEMPFVAAALKDPAFSEEAEWRIVTGYVSINDPMLSFCVRNNFIVPYLSIDLSAVSKWLHKMTYGPSAHQSLVEGAAERFLANSGIGSYSIRMSKIPFRSL